MLANATVFLPSEAALEALGHEGREALLQDKYSRFWWKYDEDDTDNEDDDEDVHDDNGDEYSNDVQDYE